MSTPATQSLYSRRDFARLSLFTLTGAASLPLLGRLGAAEAPGKPNSKFAGVQIGLNVPYSFGKPQLTGEEILKNCVQIGLSAVELRTQSVEIFMGAPVDLVFLPKTAPKAEAAGRDEKLRQWRRSAPLERAKAFRKMYEDAGVRIEIVKVDGIFKMSPEELDYVFTLAKTLGGRAISTEISHTEEDLKRLGQFADKHQFMVGYHGHATTGPEHWEKAFSLAKYNGANLDIGHFIAGLNTSPIPFLKKYHERITHVHIKDRKFNNGPNTPFGQGDTPIVETLRLLRDNRWNIQATIEFEYKVPADSDRNTELVRAIKFCKDALV
ncbi:MAG TPA: sugar phosphate isomerase/epimerase [Bacillota bacterium]|nr:sugar phosphate isomerase/epimerase [Bacillota bacterium]